jgi:hypothetical protein
MWLRLGLIAGRVLLRLLIRLAPLLAVAAAGLLRRYRWPLYYKAMAFKPDKANLSAVPAFVLGSLGGLMLLGVGLYLVVSYLAPHP